MSGHSPRILDQEEFRAAWNAEPLMTRNRIARAVDHGETMAIGTIAGAAEHWREQAVGESE